MRDNRDPRIIGAEIIRLVWKGWDVHTAARTVCPPLSREPQDGSSAARIVGAPFGYPLDLSAPETPGGEGS